MQGCAIRAQQYTHSSALRMQAGSLGKCRRAAACELWGGGTRGTRRLYLISGLEHREDLHHWPTQRTPCALVQTTPPQITFRSAVAIATPRATAPRRHRRPLSVAVCSSPREVQGPTARTRERRWIIHRAGCTLGAEIEPAAGGRMVGSSSTAFSLCAATADPARTPRNGLGSRAQTVSSKTVHDRDKTRLLRIFRSTVHVSTKGETFKHDANYLQ